jgi:septum formation protein
MRAELPVILASASPRRRDLLRQVGLEFSVQPTDETEAEVERDASPKGHALRSAEAKAVAISRAHPKALVLGADTVVALDRRVLGKPKSAAEARSMLETLSGRTHEVHTGVSVAYGGHALLTDVETTHVTFRDLSGEQIEAYIATGEPMDKAGAYGIQGRGALLVEKVDGCYFNVVGLPLSRTSEMLEHARRMISANSEDPQC